MGEGDLNLKTDRDHRLHTPLLIERNLLTPAHKRKAFSIQLNF